MREFAKLGKDEWNTTYYPKGGDTSKVYKQWYVIDAEGQTLGRLATLAAEHIRGKYVPDYHPAMNMVGCLLLKLCKKPSSRFHFWDFREPAESPGVGSPAQSAWWLSAWLQLRVDNDRPQPWDL